MSKRALASAVAVVLVLAMAGGGILLVQHLNRRAETPHGAITANLVTPGVATVAKLEAERLADPATSGPAGAQPAFTVDTSFTGARSTRVTPVSPSHLSVQMTSSGLQNWFMLRITGVPAGGQVIRIDIENAVVRKWQTFNPVYTYAADVGALSTYPADQPPAPASIVKAENGADLPVTPDAPWQYISAVWQPSETQVSFVHRFERDAIVAMRVPYTLGYHANAVAAASQIWPGAKVHAVGVTKSERPLYVIEIGGATAAAKANPTVVIYTREDGNQQDGSWLIDGAARWLTSADPAAAAVREKCTFLLIPVIDPDAVAENEWSFPAMSFGSENGPGTIAGGYAAFFQRWRKGGRGVTMAINLITPESSEAKTLDGPKVIGDMKVGQAYTDKLVETFASHPIYEVSERVKQHQSGWQDRLFGHLHERYGAMSAWFFVNSQYKVRHLSLPELRDMGRLFATATADFITSPAAAELRQRTMPKAAAPQAIR